MNASNTRTDATPLVVTADQIAALNCSQIRHLTHNRVHALILKDSAGTGYDLRYRRGSRVLTFEMYDHGCLIWGEDIEADDRSIELMLTTARSVGQAIEDDKAEGEVATNFVEGFEELAGRLHMNFELADPSSNAAVVCRLDIVDEDDPAYYDIGVAFTIPSDVLRQDSRHLEALLY